MNAPSNAPPPSDEQLTTRIKVQFTPSQTKKVDAKADRVGMTTAGYIRSLVLIDLDEKAHQTGPTGAKARNHASMLKVAEFHALAIQVKKLGVNVNQLARQANTGMVPIPRAEVLYILNQHQLLMSEAKAAVENMLK